MNELVTEEQSTEAPQIRELDCLLIPLKDKNLLLPNVTVAEVIPFSHLLPSASHHDWLLGHIDWRGQRLPAVCYEILNGQAAPAPNPQARFIIVNNTLPGQSLNFYAILVQGIPRLFHVEANALQQLDGMAEGPYDEMTVNVNDVNAMIPNLDGLSTLVQGLN